MFVRSKKSGQHRYLQIVESYWDDGHVRQRVIGTLGREDELRQSDKLDQLLCSLGKFADHALVLAAHEKGGATTIATARIGPPMIFERLWRELGCGETIDVLGPVDIHRSHTMAAMKWTMARKFRAVFS